jgi:hypothetical protein
MAIDITLIIPLSYYFFVVKKYKLSALTVLPVFIACTVIASVIIPGENRQYLDIIKYGAGFAELAVLLLILVKIRKIKSEFKKLSYMSYDYIQRLKISLDNSLGQIKVNNIIASEISVMYYSLFFWKAKNECAENVPIFTYHKKSGYIALAGVILAVLVIETFAMHALILSWSETAAYIMLGLSLYTLLFIIADMVSIIKRPILFIDGRVFIRTGIRWRADFPVSEIESTEKLRDKKEGVQDISPGGRPNILIHLKNPVTFTGVYGITKKVKSFSLFSDDPSGFENRLLQK